MARMATLRYLIFHHPKAHEARKLAGEVSQYLHSECGVQSEIRPLDPHIQVAPGEADILISMGGDGTMLRVGRLAAVCNAPVLGINQGRLGFLYEVNSGAWREALWRLQRDDYWLEQRMLIEAHHYRGDALLGTYMALNEVVVARGKSIRPIQLETYVNGGSLAHFAADGLLVATATGSTAYAMALGGPILPPELQNMLLLPIAPHLSLDRPIVFSRGTEIDIVVHTEHEAVFSPDGQEQIDAEDGDRFRIVASPKQVSFIRFQARAYFYQSLRDRMWQNPAAQRRNT